MLNGQSSTVENYLIDFAVSQYLELYKESVVFALVAVCLSYFKSIFILLACLTSRTRIWEFKKLLRRRQRERHKTIRFNEKTKALHVRFKFWYISSPYSAKQQREMTKFKVLWRT